MLHYRSNLRKYTVIKKTTENLIQSAIDDLLNPSIKLTNVLFKLQAIAFKIKNVDLKKWVSSEINGYESEPPEYRKKGTALFADLHSYRASIKDYH